MTDSTTKIAELKAQEPVAVVIQNEPYEDGSINPCKSLLWSGRNAENDLAVGTKLYSAPAQSHSDGVIVPDRMVVPKPIWKDARHPYGDPLNAADIRGAELFNLAIDEVLRLNRENTNDQATIV